MYVVSTTWLKDDIANALCGIAKDAKRRMRRQREGCTEYDAGYFDALAAIADVLGVHVDELPTEAERQPR